MKNEVYVSVDVESDGPIPGPHSMLSFGAVAFDSAGNEISHFEANLEALEGASGHPATMTWWETQPQAWEACRRDQKPASNAMKEFHSWLKSLPGNPVFVGFPVAFDFMFVYWYLMKFVGDSPFSHSALDIKTLAWTKLGGNYRRATKRNMPKNWFTPGLPHNHVALDDAREQGHLFFNIRKSS